MDTILALKNVSKAYNTFALKNVSLTVPAGSIVGLIGENGAGKTTTIKAIIGAINYDSGSIELFGQPFHKDDIARKQEIAVVMEGSFFYDDFTPKQIERVLKGMYPKWDTAIFHQYLQKYKIPNDKKVKEFSKGMRMKLSLTIALSHHAKLLILDEPTSGLDPIVRSEILDEFLQFIQNEEHSILLSSHITTDLEKVADYITFIHDGEVILSEMKDDLIYNYGVLKCGASEFETLDIEDFVGYKKGQFQIEALVKNRKAAAAKYPQYVIDDVTIDDVMLFYVKGHEK